MVYIIIGGGGGGSERVHCTYNCLGHINVKGFVALTIHSRTTMVPVMCTFHDNHDNNNYPNG